MLMSKFEGDDPFVRRTMSYVIRSHRTGSTGFTNEVSRAVWSVNPNLPLASVRPLDAVVSASMARTSFTLVMLAIAGAMALLLGVAGIYGVISYSVSQRTREIGIRMALGSDRLGVVRLMLLDVLKLAGISILITIPVALILTRTLRSQLYHVSNSDPGVLAIVTVIIALVAVMAAALPARRAASISPSNALRAE
jgi:ABC-type antimicrobial peptide transport system permease subunit